MVVAGNRELMSTGKELQFGEMKKFRGWPVVMVVQRECT